MEHYPDQLRPTDYRQRAAERARVSTAGVGAALERDISGQAGRGRAWQCVVTDGRRHGYVRAQAPGLGPHEGVAPGAVEAAIERRAQGRGLDGVLAAAPIVLTREDLRN